MVLEVFQKDFADFVASHHLSEFSMRVEGKELATDERGSMYDKLQFVVMQIRSRLANINDKLKFIVHF